MRFRDPDKSIGNALVVGALLLALLAVAAALGGCARREAAYWRGVAIEVDRC